MKYIYIILALVYALFPYDLLPDVLVGWGWLDDAVVLGLLLRFLYLYRKRAQQAGRFGAQVPTQAIGFTVATPIARFVDLGTEFSVSLEPTNSCELQVFDGLVEMRLPQHADRAAEQLRISEGSAVRFDAGTFDVHSIPYDEEQRIAP